MVDSSHDLGRGTLLGRYEILAPIASGGMARVWAARMKGSRGFAKTVAIKTMLPGVSDDVRYEHMFLDEAHLASQIRHTNVVEILDLGEEQQLLYLVMEYIDGEPLTTLRRSAASIGGVPLRLALKIIAETAAGLHAAHELSGPDGTPLRIVHRDVSPQNILISYNGVVKVTDFGIAKAVGRLSQTAECTLKGKPAFMAPEQIRGEDVDARADIFTLGIVMFQLLCGVHPFRGENDLVTIQNIQSERPIMRPREFKPDLEPELEDIILRALERDPDQRYQTARDLELAVEERLVKLRRPRDDELAELMERLVGEQGRDRRRELEQAVALADQQAGGRHSTQPPPASLRTPLTGPPSMAPSDTALASVAPLSDVREPRRALIGFLVGAMFLVLAVAAAAAVFVVRARSETPPIEERSATMPTMSETIPSLPVESSGEPDPPPAAVETETTTHPPDPPPSRKEPKQRASAEPSGREPAPSAAPSASAPHKKAPLPLMEPGF